ncbi:SPOR domain-containing protein [Lysobacter sp. LF1]|uniref:SPOR domain-containing protein n=1 Tax=Lysobacter stagni TaxID=3045172 RepID=A0ABT6XCV1_9GAMM|nr:SPOR domain-containing protein [Lysobacter sp. LF1]MDI9237901.1 SPOR domain-containing protein [Lysobacter sp. LF1]
MAARRGKTQAKRNSGGDSGLPGWAWMVLGILLAVVVILVAPKYLKSNGDGFFRPQPNPDAEPARVSGSDDEAIADEGTPTPAKGKSSDAKQSKKDTDYDFYTLLPGKEVPMSDAELAASEQAEAKRQTPRSKPEPAAAEPDAPASTPTPATTPAAALPRPVETDTVPSRSPQTAPATPPTTVASAAPATSEPKPAAAVDDNTRYLLQAGAFQASGQAEEMKARIAMLGLSARVESAAINGNTVYRVRMGPYGTASDLADAKRKLASGGLPALAIKVK